MEFMKHERTLQEAARRYARLQADDCTQDERDATDAWRVQDPECRRAYELADRVASDVASLTQDERLNQKLRALADEAYAAYAARPPSEFSGNVRSPRRWQVAAGLAASLAIAVLAWQISPRIVAERPQEMAYETTGQVRRAITLDDGSTVELDVNTRIAVRMSAERRQIDLLSGRAMFDVAHDSGRPFSVTAAGSRTTALGTKFQVQRDDAKVVVTLAEGLVAIDRDERGSAGERWHERLSPGEQLSIDAVTQRRVRQFVDVSVTTSWTQGRHIFRGTPLHAAIDEVIRYARKKVRLGDPSLAGLPVAGNFIVGDSEVVVDAFAAVLPLRAVETGDGEIVLFRSFGP
jgi:transmembrane sensor